MTVNILILFYSRHGAVDTMARHIAHGVTAAGGTPVLRTVPELGDRTGSDTTPLVSEADLQSCDALVMGSPCRFGNMAAEMKVFLDTTSPSWLKGSLINKPASVFCASSSMHGGNEATLLSMMIPLMHHGMVMAGLPYSEPELAATKFGGTPYGVSHVSGLSQNGLSEEESKLCRAQGKRMVWLAQQLSQR